MKYMNSHWGYHCLTNGFKGNVDLIKSIDNVRGFVDSLVKDINMVKYGPLWIDRFATHDPEKAGISFCQMIETSNITGHFCENTGDFYIDIFSCKPFNKEIVQELVAEWFDPLKISMIMVYRDPENFTIEM
jgi:S-adenosylmethionine/arginine decarboxylase-like enzyme